MGENVKLAPCPFCGGKAVTKVHKGHARTSIPGFSGAQFFRGHVKCTNCGVTTPQAKNPQAMTEAWNRRAALLAEDHSLIDKYRTPKNGTFNFPEDVAKIIRHFEALLAPFRSGGDWGYIKALIVAGAPDPVIGKNLAKKITEAQAAIDAEARP